MFKPPIALALVVALQLGCGGVRIGQTPEEAAAEPRPAPSEPPEDERDPKPETVPIVTTDLEAGAPRGGNEDRKGSEGDRAASGE